MTRQQKTGIWLGLNVLGAAVYVLVASRAWVEPEFADIPEAHGGMLAYVWFFTAVPIFLSFVLLNLGVLAWAVGKRRTSQQWPFSIAAWLIPVVWVGAVFVDFAHH